MRASWANYAMFGSPLTLDVPDINNADFMLVFGANLLVSHGSLIFTPRARHQLDAVAERGDVIVFDPRRSETAERYTHVPIIPNSDVWLMLALLKVMTDEGLVDRGFLSEKCVGWDELAEQVARLDLAEAARRTGIAGGAGSRRSRGASRARSGPWPMDGWGCVAAPSQRSSTSFFRRSTWRAARFGVVGGATFSTPVLAGSDRATTGGYGETRTRFGNFPSVTQFLASCDDAGRPARRRPGTDPSPVLARWQCAAGRAGRRCARRGSSEARPLGLRRSLHQRVGRLLRLCPARPHLLRARGPADGAVHVHGPALPPIYRSRYPTTGRCTGGVRDL